MRVWNLDPSHTTIGFSVRHLMISKVRGRFGKFSGEASEEGGAFVSGKAKIEVASLDTRDEKRDAHLRSGDFFDAEHHPDLVFETTSIEKRGSDEKAFTVRGKITIRGTTKDLTLDVNLLGRGKDPWGNERVGFEATASLNRTDFGLNWNQAIEAGGVVVGEKVDIEIEGQLFSKV